MRDDTTRQEFEAWISAPPLERPTARYPEGPKRTIWPGQYKHYDTQLAWEAWQARDAEIAAIRAEIAEQSKSADDWRKRAANKATDNMGLRGAIADRDATIREQAAEIERMREAVFMAVLECRRPWHDSITAAFKRVFLEHPAVAKVEREREEEVHRALAANDRGGIREEEKRT